MPQPLPRTVSAIVTTTPEDKPESNVMDLYYYRSEQAIEWPTPKGAWRCGTAELPLGFDARAILAWPRHAAPRVGVAHLHARFPKDIDRRLEPYVLWVGRCYEALTEPTQTIVVHAVTTSDGRLHVADLVSRSLDRRLKTCVVGKLEDLALDPPMPAGQYLVIAIDDGGPFPFQGLL